MESIGRLATGIAHDLNNILAPILISTALLRQKIQDDEGLEMLARVEASAKRGADIVRQVLGFGRGLEGQRMPVNPQLLIKDVIRITTETFSKSIQVETDVAPDASFVSGDMTQLHQVLLNLCVNARDAMPKGGKIKLTVRNFTADAHFVSLNPEARPVAYLLLEVTDTGHGIPPDIRDRIFEPFLHHEGTGQRHRPGLVHHTVHRQKPRRFHHGGKRTRKRLHISGLSAGDVPSRPGQSPAKSQLLIPARFSSRGPVRLNNTRRPV